MIKDILKMKLNKNKLSEFSFLKLIICVNIN